MTVASTYSMYPTIDWDSIVVVVPTSLDQVKVGDVVCFRDARLDGTHTVLHRVEKIFVKDHRLVTRGDHLDRADPHAVGAEALVGKAVYVVYFDRIGEKRPVDYAMPTPARSEQIMRL
jgi:signal peptidase I